MDPTPKTIERKEVGPPLPSYSLTTKAQTHASITETSFSRSLETSLRTSHTMPAITMSDRTRSILRSHLGSAFRTGLACTVVGCITLFGPPTLQHMLAFPALSYVTVILIVSEATLGDALRGSWNAVYGTVQGVLPAMFSLWVLGPARFSITTIVIAMTLSTFVIVLPESTHAIAKRIALAQIVILYGVTSAEGVFHPVHVAASTVIGAFASVMALLLPFPRLACYEVEENCKLFSENASQRLNLYVKAFCAENNAMAFLSLTQAKSLSQTGSSLLQTIKHEHACVQWERPRWRLLRSNGKIQINRLQAIDTFLRGMEMALTTTPSFPVRVADHELSNILLSLKEYTSVILKHPKCSMYSDSSKVFETKSITYDKLILPIFSTQDDLQSLFFLFNLKLIHSELRKDQPIRNGAINKQVTNLEESVITQKQEACIRSKFLNYWCVRVSNEKLMSALKCSVSLGLAVLFGMIFSKENGHWSGLTVAVGMAFEREATFKVANLKAQGTVLGSIYGVLSCFLFQRFLEIKFLSLLPWIIFTSFLRSSRMYGQVGATSAVIGALIILGRKNYGPPAEFAIVRIAEAFIGLTCSVMVELLLQPTRASGLSKIQLSQSFMALNECVQSMSFCVNSTSRQQTKEKQKMLKIQVNALGKLKGAAEVEPNFWFIPFHSSSYAKLLESLSKMLELVFFATHAMEFLVQVPNNLGVGWKEHQESMDGDLDLFRKLIGTSINSLKEITSLKSLAALDKEIKRRDINCDLELGKSANTNENRGLHVHEDEMERITISFLQHSRELIDKIQASELEEDLKIQIVLSSSGLGFCMCGLMKETREIEKSVRDLIQWENPSMHVNLYEIRGKMNALHT